MSTINGLGRAAILKPPGALGQIVINVMGNGVYQVEHPFDPPTLNLILDQLKLQLVQTTRIAFRPAVPAQ